MRQPWLPDAVPLPVPDDFSPASDTRRVSRVAVGLLLAFLLLAAGRSEQILDAAYGLDTAAGTEQLIAAAEWWHANMQRLGVPQALERLRGVLAFAE